MCREGGRGDGGCALQFLVDRGGSDLSFEFFLVKDVSNYRRETS